MPASETVVLRREMHRMAAEHERAAERHESVHRRDAEENRRLLSTVTDLLAEKRGLLSTVAEQRAEILGLKKRLASRDGPPEAGNQGGLNGVAELLAENRDLKKRLAFHENPHTPHSKKPPWAKSERKSVGAPIKWKNKHGRKPGHKGVSSRRRAQKTEIHAPEKCARCGSSDLRKVSVSHKNMTDIPEIPKAVTVCHVMHKCACNACGAEVLPEKVGIEGTEIGPNLSALGLSAWRRNASVRGVTNCLSAFGVKFSDAAVLHMLVACARKLEPAAEQIRVDLGESDANHIDETGVSLDGKPGWVFVGVANSERGKWSVVVEVAATRGRIVLEMRFINWRAIPTTTDGLSIYGPIEVRQWCMAHLTRESKHASRGCRQSHILHVRLKDLYRRAKDLAKIVTDRGPPAGLDELIAGMESEVLAIADAYEMLGNRFCATLRHAAPHMFVFVRYPHMDPTNNLAERMIRPVVTGRKVRGKIVTPGGMKMFGTLMTCMLTWERRGMDVTAELVRRLGEN